MNPVGYALIKEDFKTKNTGALDPKSFTTQPVRVMEFARDGGVLVMNPQATAIAMFDADDVRASFEATVHGDYVMPPNLELTEQFIYMNRCMTRKGGYPPILKNMVIMASLHKNHFNDSLLWQKQ